MFAHKLTNCGIAAIFMMVLGVVAPAPAFSESGHVETPDGIPLYYEIHGSGKTIVLLHGWTASSYFWKKNVSQLAKTHQVVVTDLRGHGRSGKTSSGHSMDQYAKDVRVLLHKLNLSDVTLVGWSMGSAVVWAYIDQFETERLRSVVIVDQSPLLISAPGWEHALAGGFGPPNVVGLSQALQADRAATSKNMSASGVYAPETLNPAILAEIHAQLMMTPTEVAVLTLQDLAYRDFRPVLRKVTVPALLMFGRKGNGIFPTEVGAWLEANMPNARLVKFDKSAHAPQWDEPAKFNAELAAFVR